MELVCSMINLGVTAQDMSIEERLEDWHNYHQQIMAQIMNEVLLQISIHYNAVMIANPMNQYSFPYLFIGSVAKTFDINLKTKNGGLFRGLIEGIIETNQYNQISLEFIFNNIRYIAAKRDGHECLLRIDDVRDSDEILRFLGDNQSNFITSDLDLLIIAQTNKKKQERFFHPQKGYITSSEFDIINALNELFILKLKSLNFDIKNHSNIVQHGPFNRFIRSKQSHIHFPLTIVLPQGIIKNLGSEKSRQASMKEFKDICRLMILDNYDIDLNPNWQLS